MSSKASAGSGLMVQEKRVLGDWALTKSFCSMVSNSKTSEDLMSSVWDWREFEELGGDYMK